MSDWLSGIDCLNCGASLNCDNTSDEDPEHCSSCYRIKAKIEEEENGNE